MRDSGQQLHLGARRRDGHRHRRERERRRGRTRCGGVTRPARRGRRDLRDAGQLTSVVRKSGLAASMIHATASRRSRLVGEASKVALDVLDRCFRAHTAGRAPRRARPGSSPARPRTTRARGLAASPRSHVGARRRQYACGRPSRAAAGNGRPHHRHRSPACWVRGSFVTVTKVPRGATVRAVFRPSELSPRTRNLAAGLIQRAWGWISDVGAVSPDDERGRRFGSMGPRSMIAFPPGSVFGERWIHIGAETLIGPHVTLSAGMAPGQTMDDDSVVRIGDRCSIGRGSHIVGHRSIEIGDDVTFGPYVYVTDQNHVYADVEAPIGRQWPVEDPVVIGAGSLARRQRHRPAGVADRPQRRWSRPGPWCGVACPTGAWLRGRRRGWCAVHRRRLGSAVALAATLPPGWRRDAGRPRGASGCWPPQAVRASSSASALGLRCHAVLSAREPSR